MANHRSHIVTGTVRLWLTSLVPGLLHVLGLPNANLNARVRVGVMIRVECNYISRGVHMVRSRLRVRVGARVRIKIRLKNRTRIRNRNRVRVRVNQNQNQRHQLQKAYAILKHMLVSW